MISTDLTQFMMVVEGLNKLSLSDF